VLGNLLPDHFLGGAMRLDADAAHAALARLAADLSMPVEEAAHGILAIADAAMVRAIKVISLEQGHDPHDHTLVAFGGAGGLHACRLADALDIPRVLLPQHPGLLSARGMLAAPRAHMASQTALQPLDQLEGTSIAALLAELETRARDAMNTPDQALHLQISAELRYAGQSHTLRIPVAWRPGHAASIDAPRAAFEAAHMAAYGWIAANRAVELVTVRLLATVEDDRVVYMPGEPPAARHIAHSGVIERDALVDGDTFTGPCTLVEYSATTTIPAGWRATTRAGHVLITREPT
jgi:N-methylhydantoinase A